MNLNFLKHTPSSAFGSVQVSKLKDPNVDGTDYRRILEVFKKYNIRYFLRLTDGNDSIDTCNKVSKFLQKGSWI